MNSSANQVASSPLSVTAGFGEIDRKLSWLKNFLEMCEAGDDIVGSTPKGLALRADLKRQIAALESSSNDGSQRTRPLVSENQNAEAPTIEPRPGSL